MEEDTTMREREAQMDPTLAREAMIAEALIMLKIQISIKGGDF